jgi:hypothetical protein
LLEAVVQQQSTYRPTIYKRFIDDGIFVWERDAMHLNPASQQAPQCPQLRLLVFFQTPQGPAAAAEQLIGIN